MKDRAEHTIDAARRSFNRALFSADYRSIHGNADQVDHLVTLLNPQPAATILDLATGIGDVAVAIANRQPEARIIGIDIANRAISRNRAAAEQRGHVNIEYRLSDGRNIAFPEATFDGITCRYALHHFPDIEATLIDARRVLRPGGAFVVADVVRHLNDDRDFINRFQSLKPDGHVRIYTTEDLVNLIRAHGFEAHEQFGSAITFTRNLNADYHDLIDETPPEILDIYKVSVAGDQAEVTFEVLNVKFVTTPD